MTRDLITEIGRACRGDSDAMRYLLSLTQEEWAEQPQALGQFLQEGPLHEPAWLSRFCAIFEAILDHHGRDVLTSYLTSSFWPSRSSAMTVIEALPSEKVRWAIPLLDATAADEALPTIPRNVAARLAARLDGRPAPAPVEAPKLPATVDALEEALRGLSWSDVDARTAVVACATALGERAEPAFERCLRRWVDEGVPDYHLSSLARVCDALRSVLRREIDARDARFDRFVRLAADVFRGRLEHEAWFEGLLHDPPPGSNRAAIAGALASITGEIAVDYLGADDERTREYGRSQLVALAPRHLARQGAGLLDALAVVRISWGRTGEIDEIAGALERADREALVETIVAYLESGLPDDGYWRFAPSYDNETLIEELRAHAGTRRWAREVLDRLG
jgi:hypothetical protein